MVTWAFFPEDRFGGEDWRIRVGYCRASIPEHRRFQEESGVRRKLADPFQWFRSRQLPGRRSRVSFFRLPGMDRATIRAAPFSTTEGEDGFAGALRDRR